MAVHIPADSLGFFRDSFTKKSSFLRKIGNSAINFPSIYEIQTSIVPPSSPPLRRKVAEVTGVRGVAIYCVCVCRVCRVCGCVSVCDYCQVGHGGQRKAIERHTC